jgi:hypothetical protein
LGVKALLIATSDYEDRYAGYAHLSAHLSLDGLDGHGYWNLPKHWDRPGAWVQNKPQVNDPLDSAFTQFARTPMVGKPMTVSETNQPFPQKYACEGFPILTAYAVFHDWDGVYWLGWGAGRMADPPQSPVTSLFFGNDPVKRANLYACALMWHRRDLAKARRTIVRSYTERQLLDALRMDPKERPFFTPGFARSTPLEHATRWTIGNGPSDPFPPRASLARIQSDTGQLCWWHADREQGLVTIESPSTQGLIGFVKSGGQAVEHMAAAIENEHCALVLTSLDGKPIAASKRLLLAATAGVTNTGLTWEQDGQTVADWGTYPPLIEPVAGHVTLRNLGPVRGLRARPLHAEGRPMTTDLPARRSCDGWRVTLGEPTTTSCVIEISR